MVPDSVIARVRSKTSRENNAENLTERQTKEVGLTHMFLVSLIARVRSKTKR